MQQLLTLDFRSMMTQTRVSSSGNNHQFDWDWVIATTVEFEKPDGDTFNQSWFKVHFAAVSPKGASLPGLSLRINAHQFDATPSKFFRDAPLFLIGNYHQQRQALHNKPSETVFPREKRNTLLAVESILQDAISMYEAGDYPNALAKFSDILTIDISNIPALSGRYQAYHELGRKKEADTALNQLLSAAVGQNNVSLRFLFQVRSAGFRDDLEITNRYQSWLKHMAHHVSLSGKCLLVSGHASRSGSKDYNLKLSDSRAKYVAKIIHKHAPAMKGRIKAEGKGFEETIVGSGTDDATDAIDRRVDFKLHECS